MSDEKDEKEAKKGTRLAKQRFLFEEMAKHSPATSALWRIYWGLLQIQLDALESGDLSTVEQLERAKNRIESYVDPLGSSGPEMLLRLADALFRRSRIDRKSLERVEAITKRRRKGAPPKAKARTLQALDKRIRDRIGWRRLRVEFCPKASLPDHEHTNSCLDLIRHQVEELQDLIVSWLGKNWHGRKA